VEGDKHCQPSLGEKRSSKSSTREGGALYATCIFGECSKSHRISKKKKMNTQFLENRRAGQQRGEGVSQKKVRKQRAETCSLKPLNFAERNAQGPIEINRGVQFPRVGN